MSAKRPRLEVWYLRYRSKRQVFPSLCCWPWADRLDLTHCSSAGCVRSRLMPTQPETHFVQWSRLLPARLSATAVASWTTRWLTSVQHQLNSCKWAEISPSLMHRSYLIEALIGLGCREVSSSYTAAQGVLRHAVPSPIVLDRYLVVCGIMAAAFATAALIRKLAPKKPDGPDLECSDPGGQSGSKLDRRQPHSFPVLARTAVHAAISTI